MEEVQKRAIAMITKQQPEKRNTVWMCGEQLKDMVKNEAGIAGLVEKDLANKEMTIAKCEEKIRAYAMANGGAASPYEADEIIRDFYGLPKREDSDGEAQDTEEAALCKDAEEKTTEGKAGIRLEDFL